MFISKTIKYVGVNDHEIDLFEGLYDVPNGMAYNSYLILDEKIAVMDSVDCHFTHVWLDNIRAELGEKSPDYLVVQHMEPDHSGSIKSFMDAYPEAQIVASPRAVIMMKNFFGTDFPERKVAVDEGSILSLGSRELKFVAAPMVHWPEVLMSYDSRDKVFFSADAFGKFGALDVDEDWACEARRYYFGIVGKYGLPVQNLLKKAAALDIRSICPLHGPVLSGDLSHYLELYKTWSAYEAEDDGVMIAYTSVYGNTKAAVELLARELEEKGCEKVVLCDLARSDMAEAVEDAFRYSKLVLATTTYNGGVFPFMREFIEHLTERNYSNRRVALMENGSWAPAAARLMRDMFAKSKNLRFAAAEVKILSAMSEENRRQIAALADELCGCGCEGGACDSKKKFVCSICGYVYEGDTLPDDFVCPLCRRGAEYFEEVK